MIQTLDDYEAILMKLSSEFADLAFNWNGLIETDQNWITFDRNTGYDLKNINEENGWLRYRYVMDFEAKDTVNVDKQNSLASRIAEGLNNIGYQFKLIGID